MAKNTSDDTSHSGNPGGFESIAQKAESNIFLPSNPRVEMIERKESKSVLLTSLNVSADNTFMDGGLKMMK